MVLYRSTFVKKIYLAGLLMMSNQTMASEDCQFGRLVILFQLEDAGIST